MKKAALYARVSSDQQKKDGTIESQIVELKKQITHNGDILIKEYIDDGHSGAQLDRPAMDQLRRDLKANIFETIYVLNADRIAREVTYQTIIISEILKNHKQIIINGKDYVNDPENKFTLTVLGAVSELERAKIIERSTRGRQMRLSQGNLMGSGNQLYGYKYIRKTPNSPARYEINEYEADVVKFVFEKYANEYIGTAKLSRTLEEMGKLNKGGKVLWRTSLIKCMLKNEAYTGIRYYNMYKTIREYANPMLGIHKSTKKLKARTRDNWVGVQIPQIISNELFKKVQDKIEFNKKRYRRPTQLQLLSYLTSCGYCNHACYAYRRYYKEKNSENPKVYHVANYKCNYANRVKKMHSADNPIKRCHNKEIRTDILEYRVFHAIKESMFDFQKFKDCFDYFRKNNRANKEKMQAKLNNFDIEISKLEKQKKNLVDIYLLKEVTQEMYSEKAVNLDSEINSIRLKKKELLRSIPLLNQSQLVESVISEFSTNAKLKFEKLTNFDSKRKFIMEHISKVVFYVEKIEVHGNVVIESDDSKEKISIPFCIYDKIPREDRVCRFGKRTQNKIIRMFEFNEILETNVRN